MPDITRIQIADEPERSYKDFPANREFKKRAEDENSGGGGWSSDLPKPSEDGYGYTESVTQMWLKKTDYVVHGTQYGSTLHADMPGVNFAELYQLLQNTPGLEGKMYATINGTRQKVWLDDNYDNGSYDILLDGWAFGMTQDYNAENASLVCNTSFANDGDTFNVSIFFEDENIHKIDPKYIGDNVMIVTIYNFNDAYYCDKSYEEILNAMSTIPVLGIFNNGSATTSLGCASLCDYKGTPVPYFNFMVYADGEAPIMLNWLVPDTDRGGYDWDVLSHYLG